MAIVDVSAVGVEVAVEARLELAAPRAEDPGGSAIRVPASPRFRRTARTLVALAAVALVGATGLAGTGRHTVRPGETLSDIALKYGTSANAIAQANGIKNVNHIVAGQSLTIPGAGTGAAASSSGGQAGTYVIKAGDTLASIAGKHGTSANAIAQANGIKNVNLIVAGQKLTIPGASGATSGGGSGASTATGSYVVKTGDTLASIAAKFATTVRAISEANGIANPNLIVIGRTLAIPGSVAAASAGTGGQPAGPLPGTVQILRGDTIHKISNRTGVPVETLVAANGLPTPYYLYAGGYLFLTVANANPAQPLSACPVPGARFMNDWGFGRSDTGVHRGTDLFKPKGTPVVAAATGSATQGVGAIGGNFVRLAADDGTSYYYAHLSQFGAAGHVHAGDVLGYIGDTGDAKGGPMHLHFEIHPAGGAAVNPYSALVAACR